LNRTLHIILLSFALFAFGADITHQNKNGWKEHKLKGRVKSLKETYYNKVKITKGVLVGKSVDFGYRYLFDSVGNEVEWDIYFPGGKDWDQDLYQYDTYGHKTTSKKYSFSDDTSLITSSYIYDNNGNEMEEDCHSDGEFLLKHVNKFDDNGNEIESATYSFDRSSLYPIFTDKADTTKNKLVRESYYTYKRDGKGSAIEWLYYRVDTLKERAVFSYDGNGIVNESCQYKSNGSLEERRIYQNDGNGNSTEIKKYGPDGKMKESTTIKNEYDKVGNLVKCIEYQNDKPHYLTIYEITYYN
jgi:hypothetical protein